VRLAGGIFQENPPADRTLYTRIFESMVDNISVTILYE
jgi:hypothetical protein